jgi:hypothetical protein
VTESTAARRTFGPVVLAAGVAGAALAMAGTQPWFAPQGGAAGAYECEAPCVGLSLEDAGVVSSANAVALVALACLGVVLVTRGRFRRAITLLGLVAAVAGLVSVAVSYVQVPDDVRDYAEQYTATDPDIGSTGWFWIGAVAAVLNLAAWVLAVRFVGAWPEMGHRYDTPADSPPEDLWKAIDAGHDPTS